jgi:hypothetical protein
MEEESLEKGEKRIKFVTRRTGGFQEAEVNEEDKANLLLLILMLERLENIGACPRLADGKIGGNGAYRNNEGQLYVTKSGKRQGEKLTLTDFVLIENFSLTLWECDYRSASTAVLPSSDSPLLHYATAGRPLHFVVHGHLLDSLLDSRALNIPISHIETMFR